MNSVNATYLKNHLGEVLKNAAIEPQVIEISKKPSAVIISYADYKRLSRAEDSYWIALAKEGEKSGFIGPEETLRTLRTLIEKAPVED